MATPEIPHELLAKLMEQITQDPGIPAEHPTVPAWQEPAHPLANARSKDLPQSVDFAIIGSGITGCSVAKTILENDFAKGKRVALFEARSLTAGATSRNGGFLLSPAPSFFKRYADAFGVDVARNIALFSDLTLEKVIEVAQKANLDGESQIREVTTVSTFASEDGFAEVCESIRMYEKAMPEAKGKYTILDKTTAEEEYGLRATSGATTVKSHVFWPYRLVTTLLQKLLLDYSDRFSIETHTPVTSVAVSADSDAVYPYVLTTPRGIVRAAKVFHCTSGFTGHLLPKLRGAIFPCRLSMSTQRPGPQWGNQAYSWLFHNERSYDPNTTLCEQGLYWMQQNAETGHLFFGGDRQRLDDFLSSDDSVISADSVANLATMLPKKLFKKGWANPLTKADLSSATAVHRAWSGILSMTPDQVPIVGSVPCTLSGRNVEGGEWIAAGFNGFGMSNCWLAGQAIALMALGEPKPHWLPDVYLSTEARLTDEGTMGLEAAVASFFAR